MVNAKDSKTGSGRFATPLKAAVWFVVLGFVVLAVEAPHWGAAKDAQHEGAAAAAPAPAASDSDYFPARFPAPKGDPEPAAPTF
jgi:hypothetical protein